MAKQTKRRKATPRWVTYACSEPQTVRMRVRCVSDMHGLHWYAWEVWLAGARLQSKTTLSKGGRRRSGNAWLRRLAKQLGVKLTPKWE